MMCLAVDIPPSLHAAASRVHSAHRSSFTPVSLRCTVQDQGILPPVFSELDNRMVTYILTIGVDDKFRRKGIGQLLIANLVRVAKASLEQIHVGDLAVTPPPPNLRTSTPIPFN